MKQLKPLPKPIGIPVPGSIYYRAFCAGCGDPIRIVFYGENICSDCDPRRRGNAGKSSAHYNPDIDWGGYSNSPMEE